MNPITENQKTRSPRWAIRIGFTSGLAGWMALIFFLSSLTAEQASLTGPNDTFVVSWLGTWQSTLAHLLLFGMLAVLIQASMWSWTTFAYRPLRLTIGAIVLASLYGISDEIHQSFVAGRTMAATDAAVDALGAAVGVAVVRQAVIWARRSPFSPSGLEESKA